VVLPLAVVVAEVQTVSLKIKVNHMVQVLLLLEMVAVHLVKPVEVAE
jgi:hypothetical protein